MFYRNFILSLCLLGLNGSVFATDTPTVVHLAPPKLDESTTKQKIVCTRPRRDGRFNISTENFQKKLIVNCYGHGGSGWTTLFGSVDKAISLFQKQNPNKKKPVRVVGAGCMGLTSAIELKRLGYNVVGITAKDFYDMPSWRAAGYFALVSVKTSPEAQEELNEIGMNTFLTYQKIDQGKHPYITKEAVRFMPVYCSLDTEAGVEDLEVKGLIPPKELVTLDFGNGVQHEGFVKYMTYFMDTTSLMKQLHKQVKKLKIPLEKKEIKSFGDISEEVIFNCAGLGAKELTNDDKLTPVRGHLVALEPSSGQGHMEYMIYTKVIQDGNEEYVYLFPKTYSITPENIKGSSCAGVLGGTFIPDVDKLSKKEQAQLDKREFNRMLDRNAVFFTGKPYKK